jgi:protocatechuate 3,4-dioxygenase beta subunit
MRWLRLLLAVPAFAQTPQKPGSLEGSVTNAVTGAPIKDASVILQSNGGRPGGYHRYIAVTDDKGAFRVPGLEPGATYIPSAQCQGYMMPPDDRQNRGVYRPLTIGEDQHITGVALQLIPYGAISGRIVNADGEPLRSVKVQALQYTWNAVGKHLTPTASASTDDRGRYRLHSLPPGRYLVRAFVHMPGAPRDEHIHNLIPEEAYPPVFYPGAPEPAQATLVDLQAAADVAGIDFKFRALPAFHIRGRIANGRGSRVFVTPCDTPYVDLGLSSGVGARRGGLFDFAGLAPGQYCVTPYGGPTTVVLKDRDIDDLLLQERANIQINGRVLIDPGHADVIRALRIEVTDPENNSVSIGSAEPRPDGTFALSFRSGQVHLAVGPLRGAYVQSIRLGDRELDNPAVFTAGGSLDILIATDAGRLAVTAQDSAGNPADGLWVTVAPRGSRANRDDLIQTAVTGSSGTFQFYNLAPGDYSVFAWESPNSPALRSPEFLKLFQSFAATVTVPSSGQASVQVRAISVQQVEEAKWNFH